MTVSIIAISGSLRQKSTNSRLLQEISRLVSTKISFSFYDGIERLPQFNPDKELLADPHVLDWIKQVRNADAFIVASPEYAHGIPGALKNALDWLVGTDAFIEKPFCIYKACPRPEHAPAALLEVLRTMSGDHVVESDLLIDLGRNYNSTEEVLSDVRNSLKIKASIKSLCEYVINREEIDE